MDAFAATLAAVGGLAFGSFMGVVIHRVPNKESIVAPRSRCPNCGHQLSVADNIPVLSWLMLRGRCRYCHQSISPRYIAGEILIAATWTLAVIRLGVSWDLLAFLPFLWVLVALSLIDLETKLLPNRIVYPSVVAGVVLLAVAAALGPRGMDDWIRGLAGMSAGAGAFFVVALISPAGMGMGDVKLAGLIGLYLGYLSWGRVVLGFFLAFLLGAVSGIALMIAGKAGRKTQVPFGPFMALGAIIATLYGRPLLDLWQGR
jgi:leader peptidase (prepilin peptidase) / N-methyltransferase